MRRKTIFMALALLCSNALFAQSEDDSYVIDEKEDVSDVQTIKDIVKNQQKVTRLSSINDNISKAWSRKRYFNIAFTTEKLTPVSTASASTFSDMDYVPITDTEAETSSLYLNNGKAPAYKSDWGITLQNGANYRLHKNPILNLVAFNLDFNWMDLSAAHYAKEEGGNLSVVDNFDYGEPNEEGVIRSHRYYTPFNSQKYNISYGMGIGPSITVAPFTHTNIQALYHLKLNVFFHLGYNASLLLIDNDSDDHAQEIDGTQLNEGLSLDFGHGLYYEFGFDLSWKMIGFGFERRTTTYKYKTLKSDIYFDDKYSFDAASSRVYLQLRF